MGSRIACFRDRPSDKGADTAGQEQRFCVRSPDRCAPGAGGTGDSDVLIPSVGTHQATFGRVPHLVAADVAFYSGKNEAAAKAKGVKRVCIRNRSTKSPERKREQKKRWFRNGPKWCTGCVCISVAKRRHGLNRCRYPGEVGMKRWVGLGVIADNLINIGRAIQNEGDP
jgi:IS5 family transposase